MEFEIGAMYRLKTGEICSIEAIKGSKVVTLLSTETTSGLVIFSAEELSKKVLSEFIWENTDTSD